MVRAAATLESVVARSVLIERKLSNIQRKLIMVKLLDVIEMKQLLTIPKREKPHILIPLSLVMELYAELMLINTDKDLAARLLKLVDGNDG